MNSRLALRWAFYGSLLLTAATMWFPLNILDIDLSDKLLQGVVFGITTFLFAINEGARSERSPPFVAVDDFATIASLRWGRHLLRVTVLCALYAAVLKIGQFVAPTRVPGIRGLLDNIGAVIVTTGLVYVVVRIFLSNHRLRRLALGRLIRAAASFRAEAQYSGILRDAIQEVYAISFSDLPAEMRLAKIVPRLSAALGVEVPTHQEDLLTSAFGRRTALAEPRPAHVRTENVATQHSEAPRQPSVSR